MRGVFGNFHRFKVSRLPCLAPFQFLILDSTKVTCGIFLLQGLGMSLPWNLFIMAEDYFHKRLVHTVYEETFVVWFMMSFNVPMVLVMFLRATVLRHHFQNSIQQVIFCLCVITLIVFVQFILTNEPDFNGYPFFYLTIGSIVVISSASTLGQDGLFRICSAFPSEFVQNVVIGQAISALAVALTNFMILWFRFTHHEPAASFSSSSLSAAATATTGNISELQRLPQLSRWKWMAVATIDVDFCGSLFFFLGLVVSLCCMMAFAALQYQPVFLSFYQPPKERLPALDHELFEETSERLLSTGSSTSGTLLTIDDHDSAYSAYSAEWSNSDADSAVIDNTSKHATLDDAQNGLWATFRAIRTYIWASLGIFVMTLTVFPDLVTSIRSVKNHESAFLNELFVPLSFVVFTSGDLVGRMMANVKWSCPCFGRRVQHPPNRNETHPARALLMGSLARFVFVPLLLVCNVQNAHQQVLTPWFLVHNDYVAWVLIALCAFSNGLLAALVMMKYPAALHGCQAKELGGTLMFFAIAIGLCLGALGAFGLRYLFVVLGP